MLGARRSCLAPLLLSVLLFLSSARASLLSRTRHKNSKLLLLSLSLEKRSRARAFAFFVLYGLGSFFFCLLRSFSLREGVWHPFSPTHSFAPLSVLGGSSSECPSRRLGVPGSPRTRTPTPCLSSCSEQYRCDEVHSFTFITCSSGATIA